MMIKGWLYDAYPAKDGITVWLIDEKGMKHKQLYTFHPSFYLNLSSEEEKFLQSIRPQLPCAVSLQRVEKRELYSRARIKVLEVSVHNPLLLQKTVHALSQHFNFYKFYGGDIKAIQLFYYTTQLFPLAYGEYLCENGVLQQWQLNDRFDAEEYPVPDLSVMTLSASNKIFAPKYQRMLEFEMTVDGESKILQHADPRELLEQLHYYLERSDPDIILTDYGDATLLPLLSSLSNEYHMPLALNRDPNATYSTSKAISYFSYGSIKHRDGIFELAGRWHIDRENSFIVAESDLEGLFDLSRLAQIGVQHQARTSIGSALSSMQISWAYRKNVLVPYKRPIKETFKTMSTLLKADRGGLHFMPPKGYHEQVAELDFASMYPTLMRNHNISSETIDCTCCPDSKKRVPELGYRLCEKHRGFIPETLHPIITKRARYKALRKEAPTEEQRKRYDRMQNGLKWILVTCFGYLGFKKSRMGRIEAHEAVNAFARESLLRAKEIAEAEGFELVHAIVDSVWLKKKGAIKDDYEKLAQKIEDSVQVRISLEGIYNWILFPHSKVDESLSTATRYVGIYDNGAMKVRGLEVRRRDTCRYIKKMQNEMLLLLSQYRSIAEIKYHLQDVLDIVKKYADNLRLGSVSPFDLVIKRHISHDPSEYTNNNLNAIVSQALTAAGLEITAGESVEFIITDATGKKNPQKAVPLSLYSLDDGYDWKKYCDLLLDAAGTLLEPFGYTAGAIHDVLVPPLEKKKRSIAHKRTFAVNRQIDLL